ncbi:MAG TPA: DinB family protein [Methylomirabilota bacterium]|jgi:uncharacterized damage-inducible protein DinB|nr:DinB family protein [Methylomirabilota bacterium]
MKETIATLYEYGQWANGRLLAKAAALTDAQLQQPLTRGAQPILPTFAHLVGADLRWFARWRKETPPPMLSAADLPSVEAVRQKWEALYSVRRAYLGALDDAALREPIQWARDSRTFELPRWQAMVHCANHGTQHRSEIAAMLSDLGHSPGDLDLLLWCLESRPR